PFAMLGLLGAYYAATDGVLAAMCSSVLEPKLRTSGLAVLNTVLSVARFTSSFVFGLLWSSSSQKLPVWTFLFGLLTAMIISVGVLSGRRDS
ncbi:MAG TPA: hypothetical protein VG672_20950, partial [Bryobacteraceae bacterium]|nr:hypothetical protein [Bryobacteraceae bacterium]